MPQDQMNDENEEGGDNQDKGNEEIQDLDPSWWNSENENDDEEDVEAPENSENQNFPIIKAMTSKRSRVKG